MARHLAALGRLSYRRRGRVVLIWLLVLAALGGVAAVYGEVGSGAALTVPGTESQAARDALAKEFPQAAGASGTIVIKADGDGTLTGAAGQASIAAVAAEAAKLDGVLGVVAPEQSGALSADGRYAIIQVQFADPVNDIDSDVKDAYGEIGAALDGVTVAPGGEIAAVPPEAGATEGIGVAIAALVLLITFGSLVAAGMTLLTALVGVGVGMAGVLALSAVVDFTAVTPILALMLGLAVGIDYALFINSRYRQQLLDGDDGETAAGMAVGTAGSAVVFAGLTVVIALAALTVVGVPFLGVMGLVASLAVLVAVLVAITLTPAVAGFAGPRILHRRDRGAEPLQNAKTPLGARWAHLVTSRPVPVIVLAVALLAVISVPAAGMRLALPDNSSAPADSAAHIAHDMLVDGFGTGYNAQLVLVTRTESASATSAATTALGTALGQLGGVTLVSPAQTSTDGLTSIITVVPETGPSDEKTADLVRHIRETVVPGIDADVAVTGVTAVAIDVSDTLSDALPIYLAVVIGLSFLLLMLVFRSILVPLKASLGFLLTTAATFGATVAVFQWGWLADLVGLDNPGPLISFLPILLVGVLFGLSMDYEVFIVSRMREDFMHGTPARAATVTGFTHAARVVGAAATIMIAVFAGFVISHDQSVKTMGFALAAGVLIDAFVVRMTIVPAVMALLGARAWWLPRFLDRLLPNVDIEGSTLDHEYPRREEEVSVDPSVPTRV
ncbi:RND superfamily putative drug exporter [Catenuloplanes nepalensis]|uniref:RND superfamily putative drug exporter n=1 Tax=Catenuloplanes nepalensis TaxID=587533 RepID=A0ABT9MNQ1_9ACTN|nr:MMPL family transporter [Catenuloplanes nepalensis]MDP9793030.1 RND superfamily putative drug exporter [Catenuloplanes nepalensis]